METNRFVELAAVNVNEHVERKQNLSYLSWAWAVDQLLRRDPDATWQYHSPGAMLPYIQFPDGTAMVSCTVTAFGKERNSMLPVMDHRNKAIANPDAFQVNTAMQRCLVKAIALHGLGLYIYAGEDLPEGEKVEEPAKASVVDISKMGGNTKIDLKAAYDALSTEKKEFLETTATVIKDLWKSNGDVGGYYIAQELDTEQELAIWFILPADIRSAIKKAKAALPHRSLASQP
jgi:hypothetical protein